MHLRIRTRAKTAEYHALYESYNKITIKAANITRLVRQQVLQ
jgi:hypothetical protein